jgi:hypothetical protein
MSYALADEYLWKEVKGRVVVLHFDSGKYFSLNSTGSLIWKSVLDGRPMNAIVDQICSEYSTDRGVAEADTKEMINFFLARKFITGPGLGSDVSEE